ncbi:hypothetical protein G3O08_13180 [Cryomorpha ignava]|uniref:Tetratricopeptide repeat protein n=1 Tax=Cryomorpha ignava TaxID=101383 RepID=A0A7K3WSF5_9FLAO|nr:hypothetical protein [Cryomorpha ignava]NEN24458.1 hypothetical protein [Cryomorpha ignava]
MNSIHNISPEDFGRIENYLQGKMMVLEKQEFEAELKNNQELQEEVAIQKELQLSIEAGGLKESLNDIHNTVILETKSSKNNWFAIAAGIAALIAISVWALNFQSNNDALFAQYSTVDPGLPVPMSASADYSFHDAMVDYKAEKYDKSIEKWTVLSAENPKNLTITYYLGASFFNQEKYIEALPYFEKVMLENSSKFQAKAQWYAVLSWLKTENTEAIKKVSPVSESPFAEKINSIQQKLK